jgi:hypothetical protein
MNVYAIGLGIAAVGVMISVADLLRSYRREVFLPHKQFNDRNHDPDSGQSEPDQR